MARQVLNLLSYLGHRFSHIRGQIGALLLHKAFCFVK